MENKYSTNSLALLPTLKNEKVKLIIDDIFLKNNFGAVTVLIKNPNLIYKILEFLNLDTEETTMNQKIDMIEILNYIFQSMPHNIDIFMKFSITDYPDKKKKNLIHVLIELYLNLEKSYHENSVKICLEELLNNFNITKEIYDYVYQKLSKFFRIKIIEDNLNKNKLNKYLTLLRILYGENLNSPKPSNFFYFNGKGMIKLNEINEKIKLNQGCVISFCFKLSVDFNENNLPSEYSISELINIKCSKDQNINLILKNNKLIIKNYSDKEEIKEFEINKWHYISLIIKPKSFRRNTEFVLIFNDSTKTFSIPNFNCECEILEANFFNNFYGNVTSIIFCNKLISEEYIKLLKEFPLGINNEKTLFHFMRKSNNKYMENSNSPFLKSNQFSQKDSEGFQNIIENLKFFYAPFRSNIKNDSKIIYDICGKFNATITFGFQNGIHLYNHLQKNIFFIGGINTILPIVELMWTNKNILLDVEIFSNLMEIIFVILNYRKKNMNDAVHKNFFQTLSLFIEQFPKEFFNERVLQIFLKIGRGLFSLVDQCGLSTIYFDQIILNEKIYTKFDIHLQIEMWKNIYQFYISDSSQIKSFMKMNKICYVLRYYDMNRFSEFCCEEHLNNFEYEEEKPAVMNPTMNNKIEDLINIIYLVIDNIDPDSASDDHVILFQLLCLDLSPCLHKKLIGIFIKFFMNFKELNYNQNLRVSKMIDIFEYQKKILHKLLSNKMIEILLYCFSINLMDVRCEIVKFLNILSSHPYKDLMKKYEETIFNFMKEFILPDNLMTYRKREFNSDDKIFNKRERGLCVHSIFKRGMTFKDENNVEIIENKFENDVSFKKGNVTSKNVNRKSLKFDFGKNDSDFETNNLTNNLNKIEESDLFMKKEDIFPLALKVNKFKNKFKKLSLLTDDEEESNLIENMNKLDIINPVTEIDNLNNNEEILKTPPSKKVSFLDLKDSSELSDDSSNINNPFKQKISKKSKSSELEIIKSDDIKKPIKAFSSIRIRRTLDSKIKSLDIDNINKNFNYGGEKGGMNITDEEEEKMLESKIRKMAKHCVDFINGNATLKDCKNLNLHNIDNFDDDDNNFIFNQSSKLPFNLNPPKSVKGISKISFNRFSNFKDEGNVIEEDPNETYQSPFKIPISGFGSVGSKKEIDYNSNIEKLNINELEEIKYYDSNKSKEIIEVNKTKELNEVKTKLSFEESNFTKNLNNTTLENTNVDSIITNSKNIEIVDDYLTNKNTEILEIDKLKTSSDQIEKLKEHFNKEKYNQMLNNLYEICLDWLLNKNETGNSKNKTKILYPDDNDDIINPEVINVIIKLALNTEISYVQRLMQDFHLLLINNKENCFILYNNQNFYTWLLETSFRHYQISHNEEIKIENEKDISINTSYSIYELAKKIHTELIINTILKEENLHSQPMNKINFLLSWGVYYKNVFDYSRKIITEVNEFIRSLFRDILNNLIDKVSICSPNVNLTIWENFISFTILSYEFMTFYNLEKTMRNNSIGLAEMSYESIIVPRSILSGLNYQDPGVILKSSPSLTDLWSDYKMFEIIYSCYSKIWNISNTILNNYQQSNLITKFEKLIEDFIVNKKKKDIFLDDLKILTYFYKSDFSNTFNSYDIPLIKSISNLLTITISLIQDEKENLFWLEEYEKFLIFLIIASSNMTMINLDYYNLVQDLVIDTVIFGLCFLLDEYFNSRKNSDLTKFYAETIRKIFSLLCLIMEFSYTQIENKKKNFISQMIKKKKNDMTKSAVYRMFNEYIVDFNGNPILTNKMIKDLRQTHFVELPQIFKKEIWKQSLTESPYLKEKLKKVFDFNVYEMIMRERNLVIRKFIPIYEQKFTLKDNHDFVTSPIINNNLNILLKNNIQKIVENILPHFDFAIDNYENKVFFHSKEKKKTYRLIKKKLFTWKGMWSDRDLFFMYPEKLKLKILNHYTSQFSRPILIPILDVSYYMPKFNKFKMSNLFNENDMSYKIGLDIDSILKQDNFNSDYNIDNFNKIENSPKTFNLLKDIYKLNNNQIWKKYSDINKKLEKFTKESIYTEIYLDKFIVKSNDINFKKYQTFYECCLVKASHHIRGIFYINKDEITFRVLFNKKEKCKDILKDKNNSFEIIEKDDDFNTERNTCYGSFFEFHPKDNDTLIFNFPYNEIKYLFKRRYYYKKSGIEMFTSNMKSYYFNFKNYSDREMVIKAMVTHLEMKREIKIDTKDYNKEKEELIIGYENMSNQNINQNKKTAKAEHLSNKIESWLNWKISNFEFLMWLNILGNRSYSDLTQYPVFPWVLKNYSEDKFTLPEDMRDFELPMGMMEIDDKGTARKKLYMEDYRSMMTEREMNEVPRVYGSHYSNPIYVSHYMTRLFPFSHIMIELQGDRFDDPNRLFISIANSFQCATSLKGDVRELTPEFYYMPEFFMNINNFNLGIRTDINMNKKVVHNVELPQWCDDNPYEFIIKMRTALESEEVSMFINNWIDLIFGYKQRGKECESIHNLFPSWSYEDFNIDLTDQSEKASYLAQIEFGLTPLQLISQKALQEKFAKDHIRRGKQLTESKELKSFGNTNKSTKLKEKPLMLKIKVLDSDKVLCVMNNNIVNICKFTPTEYKYNMEIISKNYITNENVFKVTNKMTEFYNECLENHPIIIYNNGKTIAQAAYWDGTISVSYQEGNNMKLYYYSTDISPIVTLTIDKEEQRVYAGSRMGVIFCFKINDYLWKLENTIFDHTAEITFICISNSLNVVATSSLDGFVNLYTFPNNRMIRSIQLKDNITADFVFLSSSPLPSFSVYSKLTKLFYCYSINGFLLCEEFEECKNLMSPVILTDITFTDYLIYGTSTGEFKIRKFPNMNLHNKLSLSDFKMKSDLLTPIKCLDITEDKKLAYIWLLDEQDITLIKDPTVTSEAATVNLMNMGFGYY